MTVSRKELFEKLCMDDFDTPSHSSAAVEKMWDEPDSVTIESLVQALQDLECTKDQPWEHVLADILLIQYIDDERVTKAFADILRWYA